MSERYTAFLSRFSEEDWLAAVEEILPFVHDVDRNAVQIWFRFFPLALHRYIASADNRDQALQGLAMQGTFELRDHIDTSHRFLYGHKYWKTVKCAIRKEAEEFKDDDLSLAEAIRQIGVRVAKKANVERPLVNAIAAVGLATLNQVGMEAFTSTDGEPNPDEIFKRSPDAIVAERSKDDSQGILGFLRTVDKKFSVRFRASKHEGKFPIIAEEEIASASQKDHSSNWQSSDERCWEGPVPIECTSASCGTCWVGVLGGQEKLSPVARRERRAMKIFGYNQPDDERPFLRLACQARATGNVTIVIPPWNAVFGKKVRGNVEEIELEPVTTSAKALRETIASAASGD